MRFVGLFVLFCLLSCFAFCQDSENKYPSTAQKTYYAEKYKDNAYTPTSIDEILTIKHNYVNVIKSSIRKNKFANIYDQTEYQNYWRKRESECWKAERKKNRYESSYDMYNNSPCKNILDSSYVERIGNVFRNSILRYDSIGPKYIFLYQDIGLDEQWGYWIGMSGNRGKIWRYYYTGLTKNSFYHIKAKSRVSFIKNDTTLQVEAAIIRKIEPEHKPTMGPKYELVQDGMLLELDLNKIIRDSDNDGLTDIVEDRLVLNPNSIDTDGDGIADTVDCNPRYKNETNKYTVLYKYLLEDFNPRDSICPFDKKVKSIPYHKRWTNMVVTDDEHLLHMSEMNDTYILLTTKEYTNYRKKYKEPMPSIHVSPLFPVDNMPNHYIIHTDQDISGNTFLVVEKGGYWVVKLISTYII